MDVDALKEDLEPSNDAGTDEREYDDAPNVNIRPEAVVDFEEIVVFDFTGRIDEEQNVFKPNQDAYPDQFIFGLKNPEVIDGEIWKATNGHSADYKVVGSDDPAIEQQYDQNGDVKGINVNGNTFDSEQVDGFDEDVIKVWMGSNAGIRIARHLDVLGFSVADGETDGLIEKPPDNEDARRRVARTPTLRSDMVEQAGRIVLTFDEDPHETQNPAHNAYVLAIDEVGSEEYTQIGALDEDGTIHDFDGNELGETDAGDPDYSSYVYWDANQDGSSGNTESVEDETEDLGFDPTAHAANGDSSDVVESYEDLTTSQQQFVDELTTDNDTILTTSDFDDWAGVVEQAVEETGMEEIDPAALGTVLDQRADTLT